uniref:Nuclear pore complex protein Nup133-like n=1 Tax=Phallusia mammillata TaxID=59560 RepID=A0A6F9DNE8_9ASCI|nr:nuclear pore complex protein Nup133-like [Phallusia mammillata]
MFTPSRKRPTGSTSRRSTLTPRTNPLRDGSRTSLLRRSLAPRSPAVGNFSSLASPTVTTVFGSSSHSIQSYDSNLPVLVTEAITLAEDFATLSVGICGNGWSSLISKQKLFVWSHQNTGNKISVCKQLTLPSVEETGDYASDLVWIGPSDRSGNSISVVAVSTLGHIVFWNNILLSTSSNVDAQVEMSAETEQCFNIVSLQPHGFVVTSTTGTLYFVECSIQNGISCRQLHSATGMLSGIGRRVSSFFFSASPQAIDINQVIGRRLSSKSDYELFLLTSNTLQQWKITFNQQNEITNVQVISEIDIFVQLAHKVSEAVWGNNKKDLQLWPLDITYASRNGQSVLLVAVLDTSDGSSQLHYAACIISDLHNIANVDVVAFEFSSPFDQKKIDNTLLSFKIVVEDPNYHTVQHIAMWSSERLIVKALMCDDVSKSEDNVPFNIGGDRLLGGGDCGGKYVFLSAANGLVTCSTSLQSRLPPSMEESILNNSSSVLQTPDTSLLQSIPGTPVLTQAKMEQLESSDNCAQRLQAAFLHYCRHNLKQAQSLMAEAFPSGRQNTALDNAVAVVSCDLLDDYPASDPRWAESVPHDVSSEYGGSSGSLILQHQLEDKQSAHGMFLKFLSEVGVWDSLHQFPNGKEKIATKWLLCEHSEKLCASISLARKHPTHQGIVDAAIRRALKARGKIGNVGGLTHKDFFYREVSRIEEIFEHLIEEELKGVMNSSLSTKERVTIICGVNAVFEVMLTSARNYRRSKTLVYEQAGEQGEILPWTVGAGRMNVRNLIIQQHKITVDHGLPEAEDSQQRTVLHQSLSTLADLVLDGYEEQLKSLAQNRQRWAEVNAAYERHRFQLIEPLLLNGQREKATTLAEKYKDFPTLVRVCDDTKDHSKAQEYMNKFASQGFSEFLFKWYLDRHEYRKLLACCGDDATERHHDQLTSFLTAHPKLAWMHQVRRGKYLDAHNTLRHLASMETESCATKKSYLSLGKLATVFSGQSDAIINEKVEEVNQEHLLLQYQETLPSVVLENLNTDPDTMSVFSPSKLIQLYVGEDNIFSNEVDFKKAFEIIPYLPNNDAMETEEDSKSNDADWWKLFIWCRAILKDSWKDIDAASNPFETCSHTVLFKLLKLTYSTNMLVDILPDVENLLRREELSDLRHDSSFEYLLRASFEQVLRMQITSAA